MKINSNILSIPPYVSTSWDNVASLHVDIERLMLVVTLNNEISIEVPHLEPITIESIFAIHAERLDMQQKVAENNSPVTPMSFLFGLPRVTSFKLPFKTSFNPENFGSILEHNAEHAELPDLPPELLKKVSSLSKVIGIEDLNNLPSAEENCNCLHCQVVRALYSELKPSEEEEEIVSDADLTFRSWDIRQTEPNLYAVTNPLDNQEQYSVYLGAPVGCTCGEKNCEHVQAVLKS